MELRHKNEVLEEDVRVWTAKCAEAEEHYRGKLDYERQQYRSKEEELRLAELEKAKLREDIYHL